MTAGKPRPWLVRFVLAHKRLFGSIVIGLLVFLLLPKDGLPVPRGFFAWDVGVICFLASVYWMVWHSDAASIRQQSAMQDEGRNLVLIGAIGAVVISIAVILVLAQRGVERRRSTPARSRPCISHHPVVVDVHPHDLHAALRS